MSELPTIDTSVDEKVISAEDLIYEHEFLCLNRDMNYHRIQEIAKMLVGYRVVFKRGNSQIILGDIIRWIPHSLRVWVKNVNSRRSYEVDVSTIVIKEIVNRS